MKKLLLQILILALTTLPFASCDRQQKPIKEEEIVFDIAKMIVDLENYECVGCVNCDGCESPDSISFPADVYRLLEYCKQPSHKLASNVEHFLDSIAEYTEIPVHMPDEPEDELGLVHHAVHELRRYQTGERKYYPEKEVKEALDCMGFELGYIYSHGGDIWYVSLYYWFNFATQAALLSPNLEFISHKHSPDHQIGLVSYHEWSPCPLMSFLVIQKNNYCAIQLIDLDVDLKKIFQIEGEQGEEYYLLASRVDELMYNPLNAYLYKKSADGISFVSKESLSYTSFMNNPFYDLVPIETDERGYTTLNIVYSDFALEQARKNGMNPDSFMDSLEIIYNPQKYQWDLCIRNGGDYWHKIEGTKSLYLHVDEKEPYFEIH